MTMPTPEDMHQEWSREEAYVANIAFVEAILRHGRPRPHAPVHGRRRRLPRAVRLERFRNWVAASRRRVNNGKR